jgi:hypothetical protein
LYGLEDLFLSLPETITEFQIQNRTKNNVNITIPEDIGRFKNLDMIMLDNCVSSIPDSVCTLPKLRFLSLVNNPNLTSIPDCIADLPSILFLNLKNSENVVIPEKIKEKGANLGGNMWDLGE